jgi:hypothetical protein
VVSRQLSNARAESWNAASMSASRDSGAVA